MDRPRLLDLFCGGGGASAGYAAAGFDVTGVDINPQANYPYAFIQADALAFLIDGGWRGFDAIHASPPCQLYSKKPSTYGRARRHYADHPDLIGPTRELLRETGLPYVIENVRGAPLDAQLELCGTHFGLGIRRHRLFEANWPMPMAPASCDPRHAGLYDPWNGAGRSAAKMRAAMGIDWLPTSGGASRKLGYTGDLYNAIPPAFTEWIGRYLIQQLGVLT